MKPALTSACINSKQLGRLFAEALAGTLGSDGFEQRPPQLVSVASAGNHFPSPETIFGK
jgi:hypothetical protein